MKEININPGLAGPLYRLFCLGRVEISLSLVPDVSLVNSVRVVSFARSQDGGLIRPGWKMTLW